MNEQSYTANSGGTVYTAASSAPSAKVSTREVASLVLGIVALYLVLSGSIPVLGYLIALVLGIVGIVMGNKARKEAGTPVTFMCSAGYVSSIIAVVLSAVMLIGIAIIATTAGVAISEAANDLPNLLSYLGM